MAELSLRNANMLVHKIAHAEAIKASKKLREKYPKADFVEPQPNLGIYFHDFWECVYFIEHDLRIQHPGMPKVKAFANFHCYDKSSLIHMAMATLLAYADSLKMESPLDYEGNHVSYVRRVVASACKYDDLVLVGTRHFSPAMCATMDIVKEDRIVQAEKGNRAVQGFIDQHDVFMDRKEALAVAIAAGQLNTTRINIATDELFSECVF